MITTTTRAPLYYGGYRLDSVYEQITPALAGEIATLWKENRVLEGAEAQRRTAEVVLTIRNGDGVLVGVNSVYIQDFVKANNPYYFYRIFIRPQDRRSFGLRSFAGKATREFLKSYTPTRHLQPQGVIIVVENQKLRRPGASRMLARQGWIPLGKGPRGFDVWGDDFAGSITPSANHRDETAP